MAYRDIFVVEDYTDAEGIVHRLTVSTDKGCRKSPHCLTCPLPNCIYEHSKEYNKPQYKISESKGDEKTDAKR